MTLSVVHSEKYTRLVGMLPVAQVNVGFWYSVLGWGNTLAEKLWHAMCTLGSEKKRTRTRDATQRMINRHGVHNKQPPIHSLSPNHTHSTGHMFPFHT